MDKTQIPRAGISRRAFLGAALALGGMGSLVSACGVIKAPQAGMAATSAAGVMPGMPGVSRAPDPAFAADIDIALTAGQRDVALLPGAPTRALGYQARLIKGPAGTVMELPDSPLGPVIRVKRGQKVRINFTNALPDTPDNASVIHWHGLLLPESMDGHPRFAIAPGASYAYEFEVVNRAGTYWFHPHPHGQTARQVYFGMAGMFIVSDDDEAALGLPAGECDLPLIIQDRNFDKNNQLAYFGRGMMSGAMDTLMGFRGRTIVVNGRPGHTQDVAQGSYRLRVLNGSNARIYKLAWSDGTPLTVIGTDGGLIETPLARDYLMLAPGERVELWVDFGAIGLGDTLSLLSLEFRGAEDPVEEMGDTMGGMMGSTNGAAESASRLGAPMTLLTLRVARPTLTTGKLPGTLSSPRFENAANAANAGNPRVFELRQQNMRWTINGRVWAMDEAAQDETVKAGALEVWEIRNAVNPGEQMHTMGMAHPFHIHGVQFQVLERGLLDEAVIKAAYATVSAGYVDSGWKDTVMLMPGERVTLLVRIGMHTGLFVYHCHNLEHEDMGMMRNYKVVA